MDLRKITDFKSIRELSLSVFYYVSGTIFGPLLVFGGLGYILDSFFDTSPTLLIVGVFVAFLTTNLLLFKKVTKLNSLMNSYGKKPQQNNSQPEDKLELKEEEKKEKEEEDK
jgi:F0F1-type ATP synthase assembly protein I